MKSVPKTTLLASIIIDVRTYVLLSYAYVRTYCICTPALTYVPSFPSHMEILLGTKFAIVYQKHQMRVSGQYEPFSVFYYVFFTSWDLFSLTTVHSKRHF